MQWRKDRGSYGADSKSRNAHPGPMIHWRSVFYELPLSRQVVQDGGSLRPLGRRRKRFLPSSHPAHTGKPQKEVLEMLTFSITVLRKSGPVLQDSLPTMDKHFYTHQQLDPYSRGAGQPVGFSRQHPKEHVPLEVLRKESDSVGGGMRSSKVC